MPSRAWEKPLPGQKVPQGVPSLRAEDCAVCHPRQAEEWSTSAHANAWHDPQFQAEWKKDKEPRVCLNCHVPLENQQERLGHGHAVAELLRKAQTPNPQFDPALRDEGVTCAACHVRGGEVIGARKPPDAPHPVRAALEKLGSDLCMRCHQASAALTTTLICVFTTGEEWLRGPASAEGKTCITCHMAPPEGAPLTRRDHRFVGMGIAKRRSDAETVRAHYRPALDIEIRPQRAKARRGETVRVDVVVTNARAGHDVPSGDVERFILLAAEARDARGRSLAKGTWRVGEVWEWWPKARQLSDSSLKPRESRTYTLAVPVPRDARGPVAVELTQENFRITEKNAEWMRLPDDYPRSAAVRRLHATIELAE